MTGYLRAPIAMPVTALNETIWHPMPVTDGAASAELRGWLEEPGSLTARVRAAGKAVSVVLLGEGWVADGSRWQRQIWLCADGEPLLWALSEASACSVALCPDLLAQGTKPIGDWLFAQGVQRRELAWARVQSPAMAQVLAGWQMAPCSPLWGRRSVLSLPAATALSAPTVMALSVSTEMALSAPTAMATLQLTELFLPGSGFYGIG